MKLLPFLLLPFAAFAFSMDALPNNKIPNELKSFIKNGTRPIELKTADLNGDGLNDYLLALEDDDGNRSLLIITKHPDGKFKLEKQNDNIIYCESCGGAMGDPFESIDAKTKSFTVNHYGGSAWRWSSSVKFNYSRKDNTWQLVRVEDHQFHALDPNKYKTQIYTPPKHFGKIDIADFDPENFKGQGEK